MAEIDEVLKYIATNEIKWVDLQFFDVAGNLHKTTISNKDVEEAIFSKGISAGDMREIFGRGEQGELALLPDPETIARLPWEASTIRLLCSVLAVSSGERYVKDSRYVSERIETNLNAIGVKNAKVGASVDFYMFDTVTTDRTTHGRGSGTIIDAREAYWSPSPLSGKKSGAYNAQPQDTLYAARAQASETMEDNFGFVVDGHRHGKGPTAQQSLDVHEYGVKSAADALSTLKFVIRNLANAVNASSTFMPYPMEGETPSSLRISTSLWKSAENNLFHDASDEYAQLSQTGRYYIGGLLEHAAALATFTNPTVNSYGRLAMEKYVVGWSRDNRDASVMVPHTKKNYKEAKRVVYRSSDPSANPYLAYAAVIAAGLDGIKNKIDPGDPLEAGEEEAKKRKWKKLPSSLYESIEALESDPKFVKGTMSTELLGDYLDEKLSEHKESVKKITNWEMEKYWNV